MKIYQYAMRAHRETRAAYMVCEKTFDSRQEVKLDNPPATANFLNEYADASELPNEKTWLFCFDNAARLIGFSEMTQGVSGAAVFDIKRTLQTALMTGAGGVIIAHNHPSGGNQPSHEDIKVTNQFKQACDIVGITLMDHVIVSYKGYYSFREGGML